MGAEGRVQWVKEWIGSDEVEMVILDHSLKKFGKIGQQVERQIQERKEIIVATRPWRQLEGTDEVQSIGGHIGLEKNEGHSEDEMEGVMLDLRVGKWEDRDGHTWWS